MVAVARDHVDRCAVAVLAQTGCGSQHEQVTLLCMELQVTADRKAHRFAQENDLHGEDFEQKHEKDYYIFHVIINHQAGK